MNWTKEWPTEPGWYWTKYDKGISIFFITSTSIGVVNPADGKLIFRRKDWFIDDQIESNSYFSDDENTWIQLPENSLKLAFFGPLEEPE